MNITKASKMKLFYLIILLLVSISASYSYSVQFNREFKYSNSGSGAQLTTVTNGITKTYYGWRARVRSIPILAGVTLLAGGALLGVGMATTATGIAITAIPAGIFYGGYKGLSSVLRAIKDVKFPPPSAGAELAVPNINLSIMVPVASTNLLNIDYIIPLIDDSMKGDTLTNKQELVENIIFLSGISSLINSQLNQPHWNNESDQAKAYLVIITEDSSNLKKTHPRELSKNDVDFILSNRTFLHQDSETDEFEYEYNISNLLLEKIKYYSGDITRKQLGGCVLYFMISNGIARIAYVPFS